MGSAAVRASRVNWNRFKNFTATLLKSKMALLGIIIVVFFTFLALAAPILTSHDPRADIVAGPLASPSWARFFPGYQTRSENIAFGEMEAEAFPAGVSQVSIVSDTEAKVSFNRQGSTGPFTALISNPLEYPYDGPPARFLGGRGTGPSFVATGVSTTSPANFTVYFKRLDTGKTWILWQGNITKSDPVFSNVPFDSNDYRWNSILKVGDFLIPTEVIFDRKGSYGYAVEVVFPDSASDASITVRNFSMQLFGTSYGLLGTDDGGRDLWSQFVYGSRVSLLVGLAAAGIGVAIGLVVGLVAGYIGGAVDEVLMRFNDMILVIPGLPLLIVLVAILSPSILNITLILGFLGWNGFARIVRSQVLSLRERPFIEAAKASGPGTSHVLVRHIIPNIIALIYVTLALSVPGAILSEAGLSFLGLYDPTVASWGRTINESLSGGTILGSLWWWILPSGFAIAILSLAFILVGYGLDEMFNPKLRRRR